MVVYTIGYEGLSAAELVELLRANGIAHLVDIREAPVSRKAGFARDELADRLAAAGLRYSHVRALGCPKPIRDRHRRGGDDARYRRDFGIYLEAQQAALAEVGEWLAREPTCLFCYEANPHECHREIVAAALAGPGDVIRHIPVRPPSPQAELGFD
ncbi:MAG: DUF488 domain-containing protein [Proteobacteria bacterium]|nr:DUF488 domain-containing protein [Pseudomonadota bacterium]